MVLKISVRNLVEFLLRSGDLDNRIGQTADKEAMQLGSRIHRKIQKSMGGAYRAEVPLEQTFTYEEFDIKVEGRADGIMEEDVTCIDEIKGVFRNLEHMEEPVEVHLAQAKCYAAMYAASHECESMQVQMTYVHLESEEEKRFRFTYTEEELRTWFQELVDQYYPWAAFKYNWRIRRNASARLAEFPFPYREGQKKVAAGVYKTIEHGRKLFLMAPTGVGKTIATIFPSVKAVGEEHAETIFYLTAKTITRTVAQKAFETLQEQGLKYKVLTITAKEKICFCDETECNPEACPYAKGHFDRVNAAVFDLLTHEDACARETVEAYAQKHRVCPFEMALDLSLWVDAVICDYNYLFDPTAHLRRFFAEGVKGEYIFLIDEAHNLVERGREMYSAHIRKEDFLEIKRKLGDRKPSLAKKLNRCNTTLLNWKRECEDCQILDSLGNLSLQLLNLLGDLEEFMEDLEHGELRKDLLEFYLNLRFFMNIYDVCDENYVIYRELTEEGFFVKLYCVNPARNLSGYLEKGVATIFFSATFLPVDYYRALLSVEEEDYTMYARSPFPVENRCVLLGSDVSSKYTSRGQDTYDAYANYLLKMTEAKTGNYMAFFPSYKFLQEVYDSFVLLCTDSETTVSMTGRTEISTILQKPNMTEAEKEAFLETFEQQPEESRTLLGFCVMGGVFAEGIDLTDDSLIGACIIGTGLPQICNEREIIRQYFDENGKDGFSYAYLYAGMNRVLQAAGRVIRTDTDRGVILLLDHRFRQRTYQNLFPREWESITDTTAETVSEKLFDFWC